jgi:hypothetical protein
MQTVDPEDEKYLPLASSFESTIVHYWGHQPHLIDYDVENVFGQLINTLKRYPKPFDSSRLSPLIQTLYQYLLAISLAQCGFAPIPNNPEIKYTFLLRNTPELLEKAEPLFLDHEVDEHGISISDIDASSDIEVEPFEIAEVLAIIKRLQRSLKTFNRNGGRQGYLNFIKRFHKG